jgi:hypothetical protein
MHDVNFCRFGPYMCLKHILHFLVNFAEISIYYSLLTELLSYFFFLRGQLDSDNDTIFLIFFQITVAYFFF